MLRWQLPFIFLHYHLHFRSHLFIIIIQFWLYDLTRAKIKNCTSPSDLWEVKASISSKKIVEGAWNLAISNKNRTSFSLSPLHLVAKLAAEILKKVVYPVLVKNYTDAIAFANRVFPVPGGPYRSTPFHGYLIPTKSSGICSGHKIASSNAYFAYFNIIHHLILLYHQMWSISFFTLFLFPN